MAQPSPRSPAFQAFMVSLEWLAIVAFILLGGVFFWDVRLVASEIGWVSLVALLALPLGYIAADLFTGFSHFFADNFGSNDTPFLGHALIFRFRQHHEFPLIICGLGFRELNGGLALAMLPLLLANAFCVPVSSTLWGLFLGTFLWSMALFGAATNQIHRWSHDSKCPAWVRPLQKSGLILSPRHHAAHHRAPHHLHFCITNGWFNKVLDDYNVWHHIADFFIAIGMDQAPESVMGTKRQALMRGAPPV
jgi:ubiquitin-conjugating enzyme E2 variant